MHTPTTRALLAALLIATALPTVTEAQAGAVLGNPDATAEVSLQAPPQRFTLDPEIAAMRAGRQQPVSYDAVGAPYGQPRTAQARRPPSFGSSFGSSWAGFGMGVGAGGLIVGGITLAATCPNNSRGGCGAPGLAGAVMGALVVAPFGAALATWGFGERRGGTGNFFAALGGAYLGAGIGVGIGALIMSSDWELNGVGMVIGPIIGVILTNVGAAAGYQLSSHGSQDDGGEVAQGITIAPMLNPVEGGGTVGVAGMF